MTTSIEDRVEPYIAGGHFVFPTFGGSKEIPAEIRGERWQWYLEPKHLPMLVERFLLHPGKTGAALCPRHTDRNQLFIVDVADVGGDVAAAWSALGCEGDPDSAVGIVRTPSGGHHFWFSLPHALKADDIPSNYDFGRGVRGEVRASRSSPSFIMLPGSMGRSPQDGALREYEEVQTIDLERLPPPPQPLLRRLMASTPRETVDESAWVGSLARLARHAAGSTEAALDVATILGRQRGGKPASSDREAIARMLGVDIGSPEMTAAVNRGWKAGAKLHGVDTSSDPTASDAAREAAHLFGDTPWLLESRDTRGAVSSLVVGIGGSASRTHEARRTAKIQNASQALVALTRISGADLDDVSRSPLHKRPEWHRQFVLFLEGTKSVVMLGASPETMLFSICGEWLLTAARDGNVIYTWKDEVPRATAPFVFVPFDGLRYLCIPPSRHVDLYSYIGDIGEAARLLKNKFVERVVSGTRTREKSYLIPLHSIPADRRADAEALLDDAYRSYFSKMMRLSS